MPKIAYINSKFVSFNNAKIHIEDRGLQFADSVYEVISIIDQNFIDLKFHLIRLRYSLKELNIKYKFTNYYLINIFNELIKNNSIKNGIIYLQITRGVQKRNHSYKKTAKLGLHCRSTIKSKHFTF